MARTDRISFSSHEKLMGDVPVFFTVIPVRVGFSYCGKDVDIGDGDGVMDTLPFDCASDYFSHAQKLSASHAKPL